MKRNRPRHLRWRGQPRSRRRQPSALRPWRKVGILALIAAAVIGGRDGVGYLGAKVTGDTACRVTSVVDGDTVRVYCPGRGFDSARLTGFDTPEVFSPDCPAEWWAGTRATWALQRQVWTADEVKIVFEGRDRYDRRLAALFLDGINATRLMIEAGHARAYDGGRRESWCG
jgi:endonuclease YncB( thermonuclease family)